ncbi:MAG: exo-alpha-sialidase [Acidobacteriota bacterium]
MRRGFAIFLGLTLTLGIAFTMVFDDVQAFFQRESVRDRARGRFRRSQGRFDTKVRLLGLGTREREGAFAFDRFDPLLRQSEVFDQLSISGKRALLLINGLITLPSTPIESPILTDRPTNRVSPLANPGDNIRVNDPRVDQGGVTQSESSIAINGNNIIVSFNDFNDNTSGYAFSTNAGNTFTHQRIPTIPGGFNLGDGVVAFGPNGELYYATLAFNANFQSIIGVAKSTDNGATFTPPVDGSTALTNDVDFQDKEWMVVDTGTNSAFKGNVYVSWTDFTNTGSFIAFARSTDGAATFEAPMSLSPRDNTFLVQGSMPAVAPNGDLYVAYFDAHGGTSIVVAKSTDGGRTFSSSRVATRFSSIGIATGGSAVRTNSFPSITVDRNGAVHIVYAGISNGSTSDRSDIFYIRSTDGGNSFAAPKKLNDDGTKTMQFLPSITAAADGTLGAKWWDRRNDPFSDSLTDVYMAISTDGGASFNKNFRITDQNWVFGPSEGGSYHGDYDDIKAFGNNFFLCWSDERNNNPDVFFTQIPTNRNANLADFNISVMKTYDAVVAGNSVDFDMATSGVNNFNGPISLSITPNISGVSFNLPNSSVNAGQPAKLTIATAANTQPGTYLITVSANGGGLTRKTSFRLGVFDPNNFVGPAINATKTPGFSLGAAQGVQVDKTGTVHLVFEDDTNNIDGNDIFYTQSVDNGKTFTNPIKVSTNATFSFRSRLALDATGNIYVVWVSPRTGAPGNTIFFSKSTDRGKSFSAPVAVTANSLNASRPAIALDQRGNLLISFSELSMSPRLFVTRSTDGGTTFSTPTQISKAGERALDSVIAFDSKGAAFLVYNDAGTGSLLTAPGNVNFAVAADGQQFTEPRTIGANRAFFPHLAIGKDDNVYVAFSLRQGDTPPNAFNFEIILVRSTDSGLSFGTPINVSNNLATSFSPFVLADKRGNVTVTWDDPSNNDQLDILLARSTDGGLSFATPVNLSNNSGISVDSFGTVDNNDNLLIGWTDDSTANDEVFLTSINFFKAQPIINSFTPTSGAVGTDITLVGANFQDVTAVIFSNNAVVSPANLTVSADFTRITTKVPQGAQTGPITVVTAAGTVVSSGIFTVNTGDFMLAVNPTAQTVTAGASTSFTVNVQGIGNFTQAVNLSASAPGNGITTNFSTASVMPGGNATLTVSTSATTPANTFNITITGTSGNIVRTGTVAVNVVVPDFALAFDPGTISLQRGKKGQIKVNVNRTGNFAGNVTVTAPDTKAIKVKITPPSQSTTSTNVTFDVKIKKKAPTGSQQLTFSGRDDTGRVRTATLTLVIQ